MITIADGSQVIEVDKMPEIKEGGFIIFGGELREVREVHNLKEGCQIELIEQSV